MYPKSIRFTKASILLLEEDPALRKSLRNLLGDEGYRIADPAEAEIDLVIAGIGSGRLPVTRQAATLCAEKTPLIALVDHAGWFGPEFFDAANALGAVAVLRRPFPRSALLRLIGAVLAQAGESTAGPPVSDDAHVEAAERLLELENPYLA